MMIERSVSFVDSSGELSTASLTGWKPSSTLAMVLSDMSTTFGMAPPLRARPKTGPPPAASAEATPAPSLGRMPSGTTPQEREAEARLREEVSQSLKRDLDAWYTALCDAMDNEEDAAQELRKEQRRLEEAVVQAQTKHAKLESYVSELRTRLVEADEWLRENEARVSASVAGVLGGHPLACVQSADLDVEVAVQPMHRLHGQLIELVARDNAIYDVLDALQEALEDGAISLGEFVREVRKRSRTQFEARTLASKIAAELEPTTPRHSGPASSGYPSGSAPPAYAFSPSSATPPSYASTGRSSGGMPPPYAPGGAPPPYAPPPPYAG
jgi:hypothetical protein